MSPRQSLPVILVAGFLGAGKTTLLNRLLSNDDGLRLGVVVNDFGALNVDQTLIAGQVDSTVALGNGCLCCAVDSSGLDELLDQLAAPKTDLDAIVIEASGIADPQSLVRMVRATRHPRLRYGGCVYLVDGAEFPATVERHPEIAGHLGVADLIVLNKSDRLDPDRVTALRDEINSLAPSVLTITTAHGAIEPRLLLDAAPRHRRVLQPMLPLAPPDESVHDHHLHAAYTAVTFSTDQPLHPRRLIEFLTDPPSGCYRIKGQVFLAGDTTGCVVQTVGTHVRLTRARPAGRGTELVVIGTTIEPEAVRSRLRACADQAVRKSTGTGDLAAAHRYLV